MKKVHVLLAIFLFAIAACQQAPNEAMEAQPAEKMEEFEVEVPEELPEKFVNIEPEVVEESETVEESSNKTTEEIAEEQQQVNATSKEIQNETIEIPEAPIVSEPKGGLIYQVEIANFTFVPENVNIKSGDVIIWTNNEATPHTITTAAGPEKFDSGILRKGATFEYKFSRRGDYIYKSEVYPIMRGKIHVE